MVTQSERTCNFEEWHLPSAISMNHGNEILWCHEIVIKILILGWLVSIFHIHPCDSCGIMKNYSINTKKNDNLPRMWQQTLGSFYTQVSDELPKYNKKLFQDLWINGGWAFSSHILITLHCFINNYAYMHQRDPLWLDVYMHQRDPLSYMHQRDPLWLDVYSFMWFHTVSNRDEAMGCAYTIFLSKWMLE